MSSRVPLRWRTLQLLLLPCALFGSGDALALQTKSKVTGTASASSISAERLLSFRHSAYHDANMTRMDVASTVEEMRNRYEQRCSSNVTLMRSNVPPMLHLPCLNAGSAASRKGAKVALFVCENHWGSAKMRGDLMAAAFKTLPGWDGIVVHKHKDLPGYDPPVVNAQRVDLCVLVKFPSASGVSLCKKLFAKVIYWDMLDSPSVPSLLQNPPDIRAVPPDVDILLSPDAAFSSIINAHLSPRTTGYAMGMQRSVPLYHQHSNVGLVSPSSRFEVPYLCRVAIMVSAAAHSPSRAEQLQLGEAICREPKVWTFSIVSHEQTVEGDIARLEDIPCRGRPQEMHDACVAADVKTKQQHQSAELAGSQGGLEGDCFKDQIKYHWDVQNRMVDVVVVAAENMGAVARHRPSTRVVTWMSYGVPVFYTSGFSYDEIAKEWSYALPDNGGQPMSMSFPRNPWPPNLVSHLQKLSNPAIRRGMRERGLAIAAQFTTQAVAARLQAHFEKRLCL